MVRHARIALLEATVKELGTSKQRTRNAADCSFKINHAFSVAWRNTFLHCFTAGPDNPDAVTGMAVHLSQYYRYCTRKKSITTIQEEIDYARSYLEIMAMRKNIEYEIESDPELAACKIPPLILQPIIENAIEHAIEERENAKHIYVKVYQKVKDEICFEISDDGNGLTEEQIAALKERLARKNRDEKEGVGLWNVNQRLVNYYGEQSSLQFGGSIWKGLCVSFVIDGKERL
ncbi:MAG: sensor histidine kinase [Fusicatenibacter saccharivorans]